jgi:hypothetical protein
VARTDDKSWQGTTISGNLRKGDPFDQALARFALACADQTKKDHAAPVEEVRSGRVSALVEEDR